jgi:hypothetical protein
MKNTTCRNIMSWAEIKSNQPVASHQPLTEKCSRYEDEPSGTERLFYLANFVL